MPATTQAVRVLGRTPLVVSSTRGFRISSVGARGSRCGLVANRGQTLSGDFSPWGAM